MLKPSASQLLKNNESYLWGIAKKRNNYRTYDNKKILEKTKVKTAVEEYARGEYSIISCRESRNSARRINEFRFETDENVEIDEELFDEDN